MKTIDDIYAGMCADFQRQTGMAVTNTGDLAVRLYAAAAQIYALYVQGDWVSRQCFPQTALGIYLDQHADLRGLKRRGAVAAQGTLRFLTNEPSRSDLSIPAGSICMTAGLVRFETIEDARIGAGQTQADVRAQAAEPGAAGNVPAGSITTMAVAPVGVSRCMNPTAFTGGRDVEEDEALRARVLETFRRMSNGANVAFYEQSAMSFEEVAAVTVIPRSRGIGTVDVIVSTHAGLPDHALLQRLALFFEERREIAVDVKVKAPQERAVSVAVQVSAKDGYDAQGVRAAVQARLEGWFDGTRLGKNVLRAGLSALAFSTEGVANCVVTSPSTDVALGPEELPRLSGLSITAMEA